MKNAIKADYNFEVKNNNDEYHITYSKDKFGAGLGCGIFILVLLMSPITSYIFSPLVPRTNDTTSLVVHWLILPLGLTILIFKLINRSRKEKSFTIGKDFISIDQNKYDLKDIKKIYIKDPKGNMYRTTNNGGSGFILAGSGMGAVAVGAASVASSGARATSEIMNKAIHKASFRIEF